MKAYVCIAYVLIKSKGDPDYPKKLEKLQPRAHIGYLVGYTSTNIYRIWIPYKRNVISARDILFDEQKFYDGKLIRPTADLVKELETAVEQVKIPDQPSSVPALAVDEDEILPLDINTLHGEEREVENEPDQDLDQPKFLDSYPTRR